MFRQVDNYNLKKKMYSYLAIGRTDSIMVLPSLDVSASSQLRPEKEKRTVVWPSVGMIIMTPKKKVQSSGRFIITSGKKRFSRLDVSGNDWGGSTSLDVLAGS
jgi:hypothetical protein